MCVNMNNFSTRNRFKRGGEGRGGEGRGGEGRGREERKAAVLR
jgi:hypothetical protein